MSEDRDAAVGIDPSRRLNRARAALREAAECLEDVAVANEHPSLGVASALSHVAAARKAVGPYGTSESRGTSERDAA